MAWSDEAHKEFQRMTLGEQNEHLFNLVDVMAEEMQNCWLASMVSFSE